MNSIKRYTIREVWEALVETILESVCYGPTLKPLREFRRYGKEREYWKDKDVDKTRGDNF